LCGIIGYIGDRDVQKVVLAGLSLLEYRGYDSAGIAVQTAEGLKVHKKKGRLAVLADSLKAKPLVGHVGMGHTRWATHGVPSDRNSHPHTDCDGKIAVVHNGIIENYATLREELKAAGHVFRSETDTEVIAHLIEENYHGDLVEAVRKSTDRLLGAFAIVVLAEQEPDLVVAYRRSSPMVVGLGEGEYFVASDIPALLPYTRKTLIIDDGEEIVLTRSGVKVLRDGQEVSKKEFVVPWDASQAEKGDYPHFMLKEINEQPQALRATMAGRLNGSKVELPELKWGTEEWKKIEHVTIVACGTAYHAGLAGARMLEDVAGIRAEAYIASEFNGELHKFYPGTLLVVVSQSGETADTLAALRTSKARGIPVMAITNVIGSSAYREADLVLPTMAGPEIAVASTKAYTTQVLAFALLSIAMGSAHGTLKPEEAEKLAAAIREIPGKVEEVLKNRDYWKSVAERISTHRDAFFIGRGLDYPVAMEGALKLKEISYIHAEAYAAGELKHGTLALITDGVPVLALASQPELRHHMMSNVEEVRARGGDVLLLTNQPVKSEGVNLAVLPETNPLLAPILVTVPLQLMAYYAAVKLGRDVDKPRNLAKSVTVI
jgi:glucosamine--fructose-6-phosphate aminotransferase (isomerizing)